MIEMTYQDISDGRFFDSVSKLNRQNLPMKTAYALKKISDDILRARKTISEEFMAMAKEFAVKDEKGEMVLAPDGTPEVPEELKEKAKEAEATFGKKVVKIDRPKLFIDALAGCTVSSVDIKFLEPILTELSLVG